MGIDSYFWRTKADAEIDFITDHEGSILPIEVKSADNTKAKSLTCSAADIIRGWRLKLRGKMTGNNLDGDTHVWSLPLYVFSGLESIYPESRLPAARVCKSGSGEKHMFHFSFFK